MCLREHTYACARTHTHTPSLPHVIYLEESFSKSICADSTADHMWVVHPCHLEFSLVWTIPERTRHYLHFSCNCFDKTDACYFLFSTKATLWGGSIMVIISPKSLFRQTWQNLNGTKIKDTPMTGATVNYLRFNQCHFLSSQWTFRICLEGSQ